MKAILVRSAIAIVLTTSSGPIAAAKPAAEPSLVVTIVTGERGKDSNSTTTTLTIRANTLVYTQRHQGAHSSARPAVKNEYQLTVGEKNQLLKSLHDKGLLVTKTLTTLSPQQGPGFYFSLVILSKLEGKQHSITISLPRDTPKVKSDRLYQESVSLVEQLYRVINRTDPGISMPTLIP